MATETAVGKSLAVFGTLFPRDITPELVGIWLDAFADVGDEELGTATREVARECTFFPAPAEVRRHCPALRKPLPDVAGIRERLRHMAAQNDDRMPSVERVKLVLGEGIGNAYGFVGPNRLEGFVFDGYGTGTDIATREFADLLATEQDNGADLTLLPVAEVLRLNATPAQLPANVTKLLAGARADA